MHEKDCDNDLRIELVPKVLLEEVKRMESNPCETENWDNVITWANSVPTPTPV